RQVALAAQPPGPEWLALPLEPRWVARHLARESRLPAATVLVPAAAAWVAGLGLLPLPRLLALALGFTLAFELATRAACALPLPSAGHAAGSARRLPRAWRALVSARRPVRTTRVPAPRFHLEARWRALARLDRAVSGRAGSPRARLAFTFALLVLSVAAWFLG